MTTRRLLNPQLGGVFIPEDDLVTPFDPTEWEVEEELEEAPEGEENDDPQPLDWDEPDIDEKQEWEPIEGPDDYYTDPEDDFGDVSHFVDDGDY